MTRSASLEGAQTLKHGTPVDLAVYSRFVQRLHRRYADFLPLLAPGAPTRDSLSATYEALRGRGLDTGGALRVLRQLTLERLVQLDCQQQAPLDVITHGMTWLAEVTLDIACQQALNDLDEIHGQPLTALSLIHISEPTRRS